MIIELNYEFIHSGSFNSLGKPETILKIRDDELQQFHFQS